MATFVIPFLTLILGGFLGFFLNNYLGFAKKESEMLEDFLKSLNNFIGLQRWLLGRNLDGPPNPMLYGPEKQEYAELFDAIFFDHYIISNDVLPEKAKEIIKTFYEIRSSLPPKDLYLFDSFRTGGNNVSNLTPEIVEEYCILLRDITSRKYRRLRYWPF